mmetsp:Transcript_37372/g.38052  ORF Transcript_37372/g.38052 Transcript_37372/m.38052 type:complete len:123 (-) Transcript_37372:22-390(-)
MSAEEVAKAFITHYYTTLDSAPQSLSGLYQPQSVMNFEAKQYQGAEAIVNHLASLGQLQHNIPQLTVDVQMGVTNQALLVYVTGQLKIGNDNPLHFSQVFQLVSTAPGQYYVHNEMFRLVYG